MHDILMAKLVGDGDEPSPRQAGLYALLREPFESFFEQLSLPAYIDSELAFIRFADYIAYSLALDKTEDAGLDEYSDVKSVRHREVFLCSRRPGCIDNKCNSSTVSFDLFDLEDSFLIWLFGEEKERFGDFDLTQTVAYEILLYVCCDGLACWPFLPKPSAADFPDCWPSHEPIGRETEEHCLQLLSDRVLRGKRPETDPHLTDAFRVFYEKHLSQESASLRFDFRTSIPRYIRALANNIRWNEWREQETKMYVPKFDDAIGMLLSRRDIHQLKRIYALDNQRDSLLKAFREKPGYVGQFILCINQEMGEPIEWKELLSPVERIVAGAYFLCAAPNNRISRALNLAAGTVSANVKRAWEKCICEWLSERLRTESETI